MPETPKPLTREERDVAQATMRSGCWDADAEIFVERYEATCAQLEAERETALGTRDAAQQEASRLAREKRSIQEQYDTWRGLYGESEAANRIAQLEAEIAQLRGQQGWRPIETAPRDQSTLLGYTPSALVCMGDVYWSVDREQWERLPGDHVYPTHWTLIQPPSGEALATGTPPAPSPKGGEVTAAQRLLDILRDIGAEPHILEIAERTAREAAAPAPQTEGE